MLLPVEVRVPASFGGTEARLRRPRGLARVPGGLHPGPGRGVARPAGPCDDAPGAARRALRRRAAPPAGPGPGLAVLRLVGAAGPHPRRATLPGAPSLREAYFYATTPRLVDYAKPQALTREGDVHRLELFRDPNGAPPERLAGVLVAQTGTGTVALEVDVKVTAGPARTSLKQERRP